MNWRCLLKSHDWEKTITIDQLFSPYKAQINICKRCGKIKLYELKKYIQKK